MVLAGFASALPECEVIPPSRIIIIGISVIRFGVLLFPFFLLLVMLPITWDHSLGCENLASKVNLDQGRK